jgi:hypothetical protein
VRHHKFSGREDIQMKGKRWAGQMQVTCDLARRKTFGRVPHEKAKDVETCLLGKSS